MKTEIETMRAERKGYIGGSDIGAIYGLNPRKSRAATWAEKIGQALPPDLSDNEPIIWGMEHEPAILRQYAARTGAIISLCGTVRHPKYSFIAANPDALIGEDGILEAKYVTRYMARDWGEQGSLQVPKRHYMQGQWYCGITGRKYLVIAALIMGDDFRTYRFEFNADHFERMISTAVAFWYDYVLTKEPPEPEEASLISDVRLLYPSEEPEKIEEISREETDFIALCNEHQAAHTENNAVKFKLATLTAQLQNRMKDAGFMIVPGFAKPYTWKQNKDSVVTDFEAVTHDLAQALAQQPDGQALYAETMNRHTKTTTGARPFFAPYSRSRKEKS